MMYATSKNIWIPILAHFVNNAVAVAQVYYLRMKGESLAAGMDDKFPLWWGLFGITLVWFAYGKFEKSIAHGAE